MYILNKIMINQYKKLLIITLILLIIILLYVIFKQNNGFQDYSNNLIYKWKKGDPDLANNNNRYTIFFNIEANIESFEIKSNDEIYYRLQIDNEIIDMGIERLASNEKYDISNKNYKTNELTLLVSNQDFNKINEISIYGSFYQLPKIKTITIRDIELENNILSFEFDKITDINNDNTKNNIMLIKKYHIIVVKYDINKKFIEKEIIDLDNMINNFNFELYNIIYKNSNTIYSELYKRLYKDENINKVTTLTEAKNLLDQYEVLKINAIDLYKLLIKYKYIENSENEEDTKIPNILTEIKDLYDLNISVENITKDKFISNFNNNIYDDLDNNIKELLIYLYELIIINESDTNNKCSINECKYSIPLKPRDYNNNLYYYKVGLTYTYTDYNLNEEYGPITTVKVNDKKIFNILEDETENIENEENNEFNIKPVIDFKNKLLDINNKNNELIAQQLNYEFSNSSNSTIDFNKINENLYNNYVGIKGYENKIGSPININIDLKSLEENNNNSSNNMDINEYNSSVDDKINKLFN